MMKTERNVCFTTFPLLLPLLSNPFEYIAEDFAKKRAQHYNEWRKLQEFRMTSDEEEEEEGAEKEANKEV